MRRSLLIARSLHSLSAITFPLHVIGLFQVRDGEVGAVTEADVIQLVLTPETINILFDGHKIVNEVCLPPVANRLMGIQSDKALSSNQYLYWHIAASRCRNIVVMGTPGQA